MSKFVRVIRNGESVSIEPTYLYPLMKGSEIAGSKIWGEKFVVVTQRKAGQDTRPIKDIAPKTWEYLNSKMNLFKSRKSSIYNGKPDFSVFGVGDYSFQQWKIAICALYKKLQFRLIEPIEGRPVFFDDTVYYLSFSTKADAEAALSKITSREGIDFLRSLIFFDEKRPIKTSILNIFDWSKVEEPWERTFDDF